MKCKLDLVAMACFQLVRTTNRDDLRRANDESQKL